MPDTTRQTRERQEFGAVVLTMDKGRLHDDAGDRLAEAIAGVARHGGKGTVTLKITVERLDPATFEDTGVLSVTGSVECTVPRPARAASFWFAEGLDGDMTRDDPQRDDPRGDAV